MIDYKRDGTDLAVNITIGNGIGCKVYAEVFDSLGARISGPLDGGFFLASWIKNDLKPEYIIPANVLGANSSLTVLHTYRPANWAGGVFNVINEFIQGARRQSDGEAIDANPGAEICHAFDLEAVS